MQDGKFISYWHENGQKESEGFSKDGAMGWQAHLLV